MTQRKVISRAPRKSRTKAEFYCQARTNAQALGSSAASMTWVCGRGGLHYLESDGVWVCTQHLKSHPHGFNYPANPIDKSSPMYRQGEIR